MKGQLWSFDTKHQLHPGDFYYGLGTVLTFPSSHDFPNRNIIKRGSRDRHRDPLKLSFHSQKSLVCKMKCYSPNLLSDIQETHDLWQKKKGEDFGGIG